jgi:hypothetical protein
VVPARGPRPPRCSKVRSTGGRRGHVARPTLRRWADPVRIRAVGGIDPSGVVAGGAQSGPAAARRNSVGCTSIELGTAGHTVPSLSTARSQLGSPGATVPGPGTPRSRAFAGTARCRAFGRVLVAGERGPVERHLAAGHGTTVARTGRRVTAGPCPVPTRGCGRHRPPVRGPDSRIPRERMQREKASAAAHLSVEVDPAPPGAVDASMVPSRATRLARALPHVVNERDRPARALMAPADRGVAVRASTAAVGLVLDQFRPSRGSRVTDVNDRTNRAGIASGQHQPPPVPVSCGGIVTSPWALGKQARAMARSLGVSACGLMPVPARFN